MRLRSAATQAARKRRLWPAEFVSEVAPSEVFTDPKILTSLMTQLGWTHFLHLIRLDDPLKRDFYAEMCRIERWSTRTLQKKIGGILFERTALSKKPENLAALKLK